MSDPSSDVVLTLGGVVFRDLEVPDELPWGGHHALKTHKLVGGVRVIDSMGRDDVPLDWQGRFWGSDALYRARAIDALRQAGQPVTLTLGELAFTVKIAAFLPRYAYVSNIPYSISCEVISDDTAPVSASDGSSIDDAVSADMGSASTLAGQINDPSTTAGLASLQTAMAGVPSFATASRADISSVLTPLLALKSTVASLSTSLDGSILGASSSSVGGMVAGGSGLAATLLAQVSACQQEPLVNSLASVLGRIEANLTSAQTSGASVTLVGGSLYDEAVAAYGNEDAWPTIAEANSLTDPILSGVNQLVIPPSPGAGDGVLSP